MNETTKLPEQSQPVFEYTPRQIEWLQYCLSPERLKPYYIKSRGDDWAAFHFYVRNTQLSSSLFGVIEALVVGLRNVVHARLSEAYKSEDWWETAGLNDDELNDVAEAKSSLGARLKEILPGRVVAELNFGFWVKLFAKSYEKPLWVPHLCKCFPAKISRKALHDRLTIIKAMRNRIAHHETLIRRNPQQDYADLLETIGWVSSTLRGWVEYHSDFTEVFARRMPKQPRPEPEPPTRDFGASQPT